MSGNTQVEFSFTPLVQETRPASAVGRPGLPRGTPREGRLDDFEVKEPPSASQVDLTFSSLDGEKGYGQWLAGRRLAVDELARRLHLPLGRLVEVWLAGGIRLRGKLQLSEEVLFIEEERVRHLPLVVDHVAFSYREMESCVRLD